MMDLIDFKAIFSFDSKFSFSADSQRQITVNRHSLGGQLFLDRLLEVLNVQCKSYPPTSNRDLRELHRSVIDAPIATHHKQSLLYYVLLDCYAHTAPSTRSSRRGARDRDASTTSSAVNETPAEAFASQVHLSARYSNAIQGLWHMDRLQFKQALDYLCQPSLLPTFPEAVLQALMAHDQWTLAVAYVNSMGMMFDPTAVGDASRRYFKMLADCGIADAYLYLQQSTVRDKKQWLEILIDSALRTQVTRGKGGDARRKQRISQLINLPFSDEEQEYFEDFLLRGEGKSLDDAKLTVAMQLATLRRVKEAKELATDLTYELVVSLEGKEVRMKLNHADRFEDLEAAMGECGAVDGLWHGDAVYT